MKIPKKSQMVPPKPLAKCPGILDLRLLRQPYIRCARVLTLRRDQRLKRYCGTFRMQLRHSSRGTRSHAAWSAFGRYRQDPLRQADTIGAK
jgi:hypothetical protein